MTDRDPIEEALRRPTPDEPATMPPLTLGAPDLAPAHAATRSGFAGRGLPAPLPLLLLAAVVAVAFTWQLAGIGRPGPAVSTAPRPSASSRPLPSLPADGSLATFNDGGIVFDYPATWQVHRSGQVFTMGSTIAILGTVDLGGCGFLTIEVNCAYAATLRPGDVFVVVGTGASPGGSILDQAPPGGFTEFVDGMPAIVTSTGPIPANNTDGGRSWTIGMPLVEDNWFVVQGSYREPGGAAIQSQVDALAKSIRFDQPAPALPTDPDAIAALLRRGIDAMDRNARESYHSAMYACFPRAVGTSAPTVITDGPGGPLPGPLTVTCGVEIEPTALGLFAVTLSVHWEAGPGYAAGTFQERWNVDGQGQLGAERTLTDSFFPATRPDVTPGPATTPIAFAPGSLAEVLPPGNTFFLTPDPNGDMLSDLPRGGRVWIVDGPTRVGDQDWYRVQWQPTPIYDGIPGWMPSTLDGHPLVQPTEPRCTGAVPTVADFVGLIPAERLACFGARPITLGPVALRFAPSKTAEATGSPSWLATSATIAMFGTAGPDGADLPLLVRADPSVGELPFDGWVEVTGHFDDPAAGTCSRTWAGSQGDSTSPETPAEQQLVCREQFVISSYHVVAAP